MGKTAVPPSGLWSQIASIINANFSDPNFGVYDYNDAATAVTPIAVAPATWVALPNDELGPFTNKTYAHPDVPDVWDSSAGAFDFTSLVLGDTVDIRLDIDLTTTSQNQEFSVSLFVDDGGGGEYEIPFVVEAQYKTAGTRKIEAFNGIYMGDATTLNGASRFRVQSDSSCSVVVNGWYCRAMKRV